MVLLVDGEGTRVGDLGVLRVRHAPLVVGEPVRRAALRRVLLASSMSVRWGVGGARRMRVVTCDKKRMDRALAYGASSHCHSRAIQWADQAWRTHRSHHHACTDAPQDLLVGFVGVMLIIRRLQHDRDLVHERDLGHKT